MKFNPGDEVIATDGKYKGCHGTVLEYWIDSVIVQIADDQPEVGVVVVQENEIEVLPAPEPITEDLRSEDDNIIDIPVYGFGIPPEVFQRHLEYLIGRSLVHVGEVGPKEAFFGFQEFEGKSASEVLLELMMKLEEGMAMFAQAHILIGRIVAALEIVHDQDE